jgi:hypothetical protein
MFGPMLKKLHSPALNDEATARDPFFEAAPFLARIRKAGVGSIARLTLGAPSLRRHRRVGSGLVAGSRRRPCPQQAEAYRYFCHYYNSLRYEMPI